MKATREKLSENNEHVYREMTFTAKLDRFPDKDVMTTGKRWRAKFEKLTWKRNIRPLGRASCCVPHNFQKACQWNEISRRETVFNVIGKICQRLSNHVISKFTYCICTCHFIYQATRWDYEVEYSPRLYAKARKSISIIKMKLFESALSFEK